jgi:hypothetical protein
MAALYLEALLALFLVQFVHQWFQFCRLQSTLPPKAWSKMGTETGIFKVLVPYNWVPS